MRTSPSLRRRTHPRHDATENRSVSRRSAASASDHLPVPAIVVLDHVEPGLAARIAGLQRASYTVEAELIGFGEIPPLRETPAEVARLDLTILGALEHGDLVGILGYRRFRDLVDIDRLAVHPSSFRRGVARSLIEELHAREVDAARFEVSTGADNGPAIAFYREMGYRLERDEVISSLRIVHLAR
jgi:ribosomal protein S18 acetylase RimI-like enzyme